MRICKVWDAEYPWDVRVEKVCCALVGEGHDVALAARNRDGAPPVEELPEATVHRLRPWWFLGGRLDSLTQFPAFFNPRWARHILKTIDLVEADLVLCRDLPLAPTSLWAARRRSLPVVLDMAENYPAMIRDLWSAGTTGPLDFAVRNPALTSLVEQWTLPRMDHILVVVEESGKRLVEMGIPEDRLTVVSNTPPLSRLSQEQEPGSLHPARYDVSYLGLMEKPRGLLQLVEAAGICSERGIPIRLTLIGDGRDIDTFKTRADELGLGPDEVEFHGYVENREALRRVGRSDVGVIPHHANESWETTIPNKLFDYMAAGIPIVASDATPVERVIGETECGLVFPDRSSEGLADALSQLFRAGDETRREMGEKGRRAVRDRYNWEEDSRRLIEALRETVLAESP